ncbi:response regulator [Halalkalibacter kiskunsagensis]|uniref:Response regulator n=1 Tax=Halalkalibacter kiskunsagensis TaxID=1548599 RepID=A0ABV6KNC1_9BACI
MYKVLIVDDEAIERRGLRKIINDAFSTIVIEEAENGRTAILKSEEFRPDVVFMDIKMPGIDGVEAAKEIKKMNRAVQIIMVTAFDTFEYARQVMKIGVKDYILKPSTKEEIISPLKKLLAEIEIEREKRTEEIILKDNYRRALSIVQSRVITSMLLDSSNARNVVEFEWEETFQKESFVMVFEFKKRNQKTTYKETNEYILFLQSELSHFFHENFIGEEVMGRLPVLVQLEDKDVSKRNQIRDRAMTCGKKIIIKSRNYYPDYDLSVGIGRTYDEMEKFIQSYHEALFSLSSLKYPYLCQYYNHHVREAGEGDNVGYPYGLEKKLLEAVTTGVVEEVPLQFRKYMDVLIRYCEMSKETVEGRISELYVLLSRQVVDSGIPIIVNQPARETNSPSVLQEELTKIASHIQSMYYSQNKDILLIAKEYISKHYEKALTLEEVADVVELSPQYFSKIFKERSGSSFIDYLTKIRVDQAKELMRTKGRSVKEVCFEVGYKDPNYFSRVFKKYTGVSPSDYRHTLV